MKWWFEIDLWKRVIAALVLGTLAGIALRAGLGADAAAAFATDWVKWLGDLFLRLIRMLVVPLVFVQQQQAVRLELHTHTRGHTRRCLLVTV